MRVLVCGDRNWSDASLIAHHLAKLEHAEIIEGEARGADRLARIEAEKLGYVVHKFPAQWGVYGKAAGVLRNKQMLDEGKPSLVLAFHDDLEHSKGTGDMVRRAKARGIPVNHIHH